MLKCLKKTISPIPDTHKSRRQTLSSGLSVEGNNGHQAIQLPDFQRIVFFIRLIGFFILLYLSKLICCFLQKRFMSQEIISIYHLYKLYCIMQVRQLSLMYLKALLATRANFQQLRRALFKVFMLIFPISGHFCVH